MPLLKSLRYALAALVLAWIQAVPCAGYTVVRISTASAPGFEESFIAATTAQFTASVFKNPLASHTYQLTLFGPNPTYSPPLTQQDLLRSLVAVSSNDYVYGWADGRDSERWNDLGKVDYYAVNCSSVTMFDMQFGTTTNHVDIDQPTCNRVLAVLRDAIYQQFFSTPIVLGGH
jgi:hypothetical protein